MRPHCQTRDTSTLTTSSSQRCTVPSLAPILPTHLRNVAERRMCLHRQYAVRPTQISCPRTYHMLTTTATGTGSWTGPMSPQPPCGIRKLDSAPTANRPSHQVPCSTDTAWTTDLSDTSRYHIWTKSTTRTVCLEVFLAETSSAINPKTSVRRRWKKCWAWRTTTRLTSGWRMVHISLFRGVSEATSPC